MFLLLTIAVSGFSALAQTMYVNTKSGLILRSEAAQTGAKIRSIPYGDAVDVAEEGDKRETIGGKTGTWRYATYKGDKGYVFDAFLSSSKPTDAKPATPKAVTRYINARSGLIVRSKANRESSKLITIPFRTACKVDMETSYGEQTINELEGTWRKCTYKGKTGYIFDAYLSESLEEFTEQSSCGS